MKHSALLQVSNRTDSSLVLVRQQVEVKGNYEFKLGLLWLKSDPRSDPTHKKGVE